MKKERSHWYDPRGLEATLIYRYLIEEMSRTENEVTDERLRELGLEGWEMVSVLPGRRAAPDDGAYFTCFFRRDASTDIGL
jgi:hypothetical protein